MSDARFVATSNPYVAKAERDGDRWLLHVYVDDVALFEDVFAANPGKRFSAVHCSPPRDCPGVVADAANACLHKRIFSQGSLAGELTTTIEANLDMLFGTGVVAWVTGSYIRKDGFTDYARPCIEVTVKAGCDAGLVPAFLGDFPTSTLDESTIVYYE